MTTDAMTGGTLHEDAASASAVGADEVRITGAQRAGEPAQRSDDAAPGADAGASSDPGPPIPRDGDGAPPAPSGVETAPAARAPEPMLPHWTEAPTGEVPAVLARPGDVAADDQRAAASQPSWREARSDWELEQPLAPSLLEPDDEAPVQEPDVADRQPWSFELEVPERGLAGLDELEGEELARLGNEVLFEEWSGAGPGHDERDVPTSEIEVGAPADESGDHASGRGPAGTPAWRAGRDVGRDELADPRASTRADGADGATGRAGGEAETGEGQSAATDSGEAETDEAGDAGTGAVETGSAVGRGGPRSAASHRVEPDAALASDLAARGSRFAYLARRSDRLAGPAQRPGRPGARRATHRSRAGRSPGDDPVSRRAGRNIPLAVASGLVIGALTLIAFHFGTVPSMVVVTVVLGLAAAEAYAAFRRGGYRPATLLGIAAAVVLIVATYLKGFEAFPAVAVVLVAFTFLWQLVGVDPKAQPVQSIAATIFVFCWVGVFGSFAALLLAPSLFPHRTGIAYLLGALVAAVAYDVGALAAGAAVGRHQLSAVSPGKTWEGVAGGTLAAMVLAVGVVHLIHPWTLAESAVLGAVVAVVSPIGDLCESLVKRHLKIKDMGRMLPGHGGLLDRIDGVLFVLPAVYYLVRAFHH